MYIPYIVIISVAIVEQSNTSASNRHIWRRWQWHISLHRSSAIKEVHLLKERSGQSRSGLRDIREEAHGLELTQTWTWRRMKRHAIAKTCPHPWRTKADSPTYPAYFNRLSINSEWPPSRWCEFTPSRCYPIRLELTYCHPIRLQLTNVSCCLKGW